MQVNLRFARWAWFALVGLTTIACSALSPKHPLAPRGIAQFATEGGMEFRTCTTCPGPTAKHPIDTVRESVEIMPPAISTEAAPAAAGAPTAEAPPLTRAETDLTISFASGVTDLDDGSAAHIDHVLEQLGGPVIEVRIAAYTDCTGSRPLNDRIARARADAVRAHLEALRLPDARINVRSRGRCCYAASNATESGRAANRRAVLTFLYQPQAENHHEPSV